MNDPIGFYRAFQELLRGREIRAKLTSGMACVEYGLQQHRSVCLAARDHGLPPAPLASEEARHEIYDRGRERAAALVAAAPAELAIVAMPLDTILP